METLFPILDELVQLNNDKIAKLGDTILFTCFKYETTYLFQVQPLDICMYLYF